MNKPRIFVATVSMLMIFALIMPALAQKKAGPLSSNPKVALETTMGNIIVELFPAKAPITTKNFLEYVNSGFYNGTIVHRVDFVVGLGGYTESMLGKPTRPPIKNESKNGLKNLRGTLAMARFEPHTATSQFFINVKNNSHLDPQGAEFGYAVFGKVIAGMDVVDKIAKVRTGTKGPFSNIPLETILVKRAVSQ